MKRCEHEILAAHRRAERQRALHRGAFPLPPDRKAPTANPRAFARGADEALTLRPLREVVRALWHKLLAVVAARSGEGGE